MKFVGIATRNTFANKDIIINLFRVAVFFSLLTAQRNLACFYLSFSAVFILPQKYISIRTQKTYNILSHILFDEISTDYDRERGVRDHLNKLLKMIGYFTGMGQFIRVEKS